MQISLDQVEVFVAIVDEGSFSAAARALSRGQSAITYTIQKLEEQIDGDLFDRSGYRPKLTEAGRALLPFARRIMADAGAFYNQALSISGGLEAEMTLAIDSMFPTSMLVEALGKFQHRFPSVQPRLYVQNLGATAQLVVDRTCAAGVLISFAADPALLTRIPLMEVELAMVVAPGHPLAAIRGPVPRDAMRDHVQLVLSDPSGATGNRDFGVNATKTWRLADLGAKHAMLRGGLGFGGMPLHIVADDLAAGTLVQITPAEWDGRNRAPILPLCAAYCTGKPVGPATRWMLDLLCEIAGPRTA